MPRNFGARCSYRYMNSLSVRAVEHILGDDVFNRIGSS